MRTLTTLLLAWLFIGPAVGRSHFQRKDPDINISISPASFLDKSSHAPRADTNSPTDLSWVKIWAALGDSFTAGIGAGQLYTWAVLTWHALGMTSLGLRYWNNGLVVSGISTFLPVAEIDHISTILQPNIRDILTELNNKVKKDGILVYTLYAQYFNTENEDCAEKHDWSFPSVAGFEALPLTVERREKFNKLVLNINNAIKEVVYEYNSNPDIGYRITTADWDVWPRQAVVGQFCVPGTGRDYPDEDQPDLHSFRPSLGSKEPGGHDGLKRRALMSRGTVNESEAQQYEAEIYNSMFYSSANPGADTIRSLEGRAPFPADCPGDDSWTYGFGLPDRWGKWFHPNELGHRTIASFVLEAIFAQRVKILGVTNEACTDTMDRTYKIYCDEVNLLGDSDERVFYDNTPDGHRYRIFRTDSSSEFSVENCKSAFKSWFIAAGLAAH
ncbi:uncharacterized protein APUU_31187A [Aspergillus puulaauensis]|uniref:SGNH hydrolase-type esterase domain-containing protein n=1 Tax=Aspergillus puulaauensis TaxID=1220207 RepID=A0A7R8ALR3_9EURO|nr:uncharacterized protein APUU_31187A [Aspergillus puulaauensis]BCS22962.1 hypothetical protein APUU_31187A [Aspergillus puulaauensis]